MATYTIDTAKDLYYLNPSDTDEHNTVLTRSIPAAKVLFGNKISPDLLDLYENQENPIAIKSQDENTITIAEDNYIASTYRIYVNGKGYKIEDVNTDSTTGDIVLTPKRAIPAGATTFTAQILNTLEIIWGYCLVYQFTISGRELVTRDILFSKDRYEDGSLLPANDNDIDTLQAKTMSSISENLLLVNSSTGISNNPIFLRR